MPEETWQWGDFLFEFDKCLPDFEPSLIMDVYYRALEGYDVVAAAPRRDVANDLAAVLCSI